MGQGTFGQVVMCKTLRTGELVAIKVIKNQYSYHAQGEKEIAILSQVHFPLDFMINQLIRFFSKSSRVGLMIKIDFYNYGSLLYLGVIYVQFSSYYRLVYTRY
jgi:serine/threonine protein kinase